MRFLKFAILPGILGGPHGTDQKTHYLGYTNVGAQRPCLLGTVEESTHPTPQSSTMLRGGTLDVNEALGKELRVGFLRLRLLHHAYEKLEECPGRITFGC